MKKFIANGYAFDTKEAAIEHIKTLIGAQQVDSAYSSVDGDYTTSRHISAYQNVSIGISEEEVFENAELAKEDANRKALEKKRENEKEKKIKELELRVRELENDKTPVENTVSEPIPF